MEKVHGKSSRGPSQNDDRKTSSQNRKKSHDNDNCTNDNTPKSNRINIINLLMNKQDDHCIQKNSESLKQPTAENTNQDHMSIHDILTTSKNAHINKSMNDFECTKMKMCNASPAPAFGLLKKDSSVSDIHFDTSKSPNFFPKQDEKIGLCSQHFKASKFNHFVPDEESDMEQDEAVNNIIPGFQLSDKPHNPFEADAHQEGEDFNTPKLGEDPEPEDEDPIIEFFSPMKTDENINVSSQAKDSNKIKLKLSKVRSGIQKPDENTKLCGKKRNFKKASSSGSEEKKASKRVSQKSKPQSPKNGKKVLADVPKPTQPKLKKRDLKNIEKVGRNRNTRSEVSESVDQDSAGMRKSLRLKKKENNLEECKGCTCKKSQCIKLYCECFIAKGFCSPSCSCEDCFNMEENEEEILKIRQKIQSRNQHAFKTKVVGAEEQEPKQFNLDEDRHSNEPLKHVKGCNCKKSQCSNNYCECHQLGAKCSDLCSCTDCKN